MYLTLIHYWIDLRMYFYFSKVTLVSVVHWLTLDNDGYPRNDIDIYAVRTARNKVISEYVFHEVKQGFKK